MYKILVVDDEAEIVQILEKFLRKFDYDIIIGFGGEEALQQLAAHGDIALMVIDIKMPRVSGIDVLSNLQENGRKVPAIVLSGSIGMQKDIDKLKKLGFEDENILFKPIDLYVLLGRVRKMIDPRPSEEENSA